MTVPNTLRYLPLSDEGPATDAATLIPVQTAPDGIPGQWQLATLPQLSRAAGIYNVMDPRFAGGAKRDGVTDDTDAIQAALTAGAGATVYLPGPGTYVATQLWIPENTTVLGTIGTVLLRKAGSVTNAAVQDANNVINIGPSVGTRYDLTDPGAWVLIENIVVDGNCDNQTVTASTSDQGGSCISLRNVQFPTLRNVEVRNGCCGGLLTSMATGVVLDRVIAHDNATQATFLGTGNGIDIYGLSDSTHAELRAYVVLTSCMSYSNADAGFSISTASDVIAIGCEAWSNGNSSSSTDSALGFEVTGVAGLDFPARIIIASCIAVGNVRAGSSNNAGFRIGCYGDLAADVQLSNLIAKGHTGDGVDVTMNDGTTHNNGVQLSNILVDGFGTAGSTFYGVLIHRNTNALTDNVELTNIQVKNGLGTGADVGILSNSDTTNFLQNLVISNADLTSGPSTGLLILGSLKNIRLMGVLANGFSTNGIQITPNNAAASISKVILVGCQSQGNTTDGLELYPNSGTIDLVSVSACQFNGNGGYGIKALASVAMLRIDRATDLTGNTTGTINAGGAGVDYDVPGCVADAGDAAYSFVPATSPRKIIYHTAITTPRAVSLGTTGAVAGLTVRVIRDASCTGASSVNVGTGPLKALSAASTYVDVTYNGTAWVESGSGSL